MSKKAMHGHGHAPHHARGGAKKMMDGAMLPKKSTGHYEAHARGVHRADGHIPGAPHSASIHAANAGISQSSRSPGFPNPPMGKGEGAGGY